MLHGFLLLSRFVSRNEWCPVAFRPAAFPSVVARCTARRIALCLLVLGTMGTRALALAASGAATSTPGLQQTDLVDIEGRRANPPHAPPSDSVQRFANGRLRFGDDPRWAAPTFDDTNWPRRLLYRAPDTTGTYWIRVPVRLGAEAFEQRPARVELSALAAAEAYWDGVRIGQSGRVGTTQADEIPGTLRSRFHVPDALYTPGRHLIALRLSNHHMPRGFAYSLYALNVGPLVRDGIAASTVLPLLFMGGFLFIVVYCGVLFVLNPRRRALGVLALFCLAVALLVGTESLRAFVNYTYDWHAVRVNAITGLTAAVGFLLPWCVVEQFAVPHRSAVLAGVAAGLAGAFALSSAADFAAFWMYVVAMGSALALSGWAALRGRRGGWTATAGLGAALAVLVGTGLDFASSYFSPAFAALVVGLLATLAVQAHRDSERRRRADLRQTRLELELLKRHIQPHFLMNTLTAAMEWIEAEPREGVRFLGALAEVLRRLGDMAGARLVRVREELALCHAYLEVMGYRGDAAFALTTHGVDPDAWIPPAVFHTLLENGLTHNAYPPGQAAAFSLVETAAASGCRRYVVHTPPGACDVSAAPPEEGTGLRYVRTRLEEVAPGAWHLESRPAPDAAAQAGWTTVIEVPADVSPVAAPHILRFASSVANARVSPS